MIEPQKNNFYQGETRRSQSENFLIHVTKRFTLHTRYYERRLSSSDKYDVNITRDGEKSGTDVQLIKSKQTPYIRSSKLRHYK